jgi:2-formylbenzoate dehydrogenase
MSLGIEPDRPPAELRRAVLERDWRMLIGGDLVDARATFESIDPSTATACAQVPDADVADVDVCVAAALAASAAWAELDPEARADMLFQAAAILERHVTELAVIDAIDGGNPRRVMESDVRVGIAALRRCAGWSLLVRGESFPADASRLHYSLRQPFGVVGRIIPFNHPIGFAIGKIAAPLAAGNTVVLKPAPQTPLSALRMGELVADVLPRGVLNIVTGSGVGLGEAIVRHPQVRRIAFTGSHTSGMRVQQLAATSAIKTVSLELGGKNPLIICADADVAQAARAAFVGMNLTATQGQSCGSTSRVLADERIIDQVLETLVASFTAVRVGDALSESTQMGPVVSAEQFLRVERCVENARGQGATVRTGGGRPPGLDRGYFYAPTIVTDIAQDAEVVRTEIFGPVLCVMPFRTEEEAVHLANDTEFGLTASIWTRDLSRAHRLASRLAAGYVWINDVARHYPGVPFGGTRNSGIGKEEAIEELYGFTEQKAVNVRLG